MLTGSVRDENGATLAGVAITVADPDGRQLARARTNAAGRYRVAGVPRGSHVVIASTPRRHPEVGTAVVGGGPATCDFTLTAAGVGAVVGQVRSPHGGGLGAVTVVVTDIDRRSPDTPSARPTATTTWQACRTATTR